jgi:hypothetical protein
MSNPRRHTGLLLANLSLILNLNDPNVMDQVGGSWTQMTETTVGGLCRSPEELDEEATSQQADTDPRFSLQRNASVLNQTQAHSDASSDSGRQVIITLSQSHLLTSQSTPPSVHQPGAWTENQDHRSYIHSPSLNRESPLLGGSQASSSPASTPSHSNPNDFLPRAVAGGSPKWLNIQELFPHLKEDDIETWLKICEAYRARTYSGGDTGHLDPLPMDAIENEPCFSPIPATYLLPQYTPSVEHRQNQEVPEELIDDDAEKDGKEQSKAE